MYQFSYIKSYSNKQDANLVLLDDIGRVRSQKTSVLCQIQQYIRKASPQRSYASNPRRYKAAPGPGGLPAGHLATPCGIA